MAGIERQSGEQANAHTNIIKMRPNLVSNRKVRKVMVAAGNGLQITHSARWRTKETEK